MNIINGYPPNIETLRKHFDIQPTVIFTYGNDLYNPAGKDIPAHLMVHESVHAEQHRTYPSGASAWWGRYIADKKFRLEQEVEAYRAQYKFLIEHCNRDFRRRVVPQIIRDLSSGIYGNIVTAGEAEALICGN